MAIKGVGKQVVSASLDGTIRVWEVGSAKEVRKFEMEKRRAVHGMKLVEDEAGIASLGGEGEERLVIGATQTGMEVFRCSDGERIQSLEWGLGANMVSFDYSAELGLIVTGHTNGAIGLRRLGVLDTVKVVRRNEASLYSVKFDKGDLLVGTAAGLPARLGVKVDGKEIVVQVKEEYGGWEAVGIETWAVGEDGAWCAGGEGGLRRY